MRFVEITDGFYSVPISEEEEILLSKMNEEQRIPKKKLDEREQEIARRLTTRGVLNRIKEEDTLYYTLNVNLEG